MLVQLVTVSLDLFIMLFYRVVGKILM